MRISRKKFRTFFEIFVSRPRYQCKNYCDKNMKQGCSETSNLSLYVCMFVCFFLYFFRIPSYPRIPARANLVPRVLSLPRESRESTLGTGSTTDVTAEEGNWVPVIGSTTGSTGNEKIKGVSEV